MNFSLGGSKDKGKSKSQNTNVLDPEYKNLVYGNAERAAGLANSFAPYSGERVAGFNADQGAAFDALRAIQSGAVGSGTLGAAIGQANMAGAYVPERVSAMKLSDVDLSGYMDPYVGQVVDTSNADLARQRAIENLENASRATQAGAFGGTGAEIARSLTSDNYARAMASNSATLRSQAFQNAQNMGLEDLSRRLSADQGNQSAGLQANQQRLSAAGLLGQFGDQELSQAITRAGLLRTAGDAQQAQQQRMYDVGYEDWRYQQEREIALQNLINASIGMVPQTGTTYQTGKNLSTRIEGNGSSTRQS